MPIPIAVAALIILISTGHLMAEFFGGMPAPARFAQRVFAPFYLTNTYGLFAVMTTVRREIIVQGSNDGTQWRDYEFKNKPAPGNRRPRWATPPQPRLYWQEVVAAPRNTTGD